MDATIVIGLLLIQRWTQIIFACRNLCRSSPLAFGCVTDSTADLCNPRGFQMLVFSPRLCCFSEFQCVRPQMFVPPDVADVVRTFVFGFCCSFHECSDHEALFCFSLLHGALFVHRIRLSCIGFVLRLSALQFEKTKFPRMCLHLILLGRGV